MRQIELAEAAAAVEAKLNERRDRGQAPTVRALQSATSASRRLTYAEQQQVVRRVLAAPAASAT